MIPWNQAYKRIRESDDFAQLFGKMYRQDEFRPYSYAIKFDSLPPALQADPANPNTGSIAQTRADAGAPTTNTVPGPAQTRIIDFPAGAVILGISACANIPQGVITRANLIPPNDTFNIPYAPIDIGGGREMFVLDLRYVDDDPITTGNPISELVPNPASAIVTRPPIMAEALLGNGRDSDTPVRELFVAPGNGLVVSCRSLLLPTFMPASGDPPPNMSVHVVFHAMVPGVVKAAKAA